MTLQAQSDDNRLQITLLQERNAGTFSRVYLAEARGGGGLARVVAVKVIKEQWSESNEILTRTRDEARLLARLQHRNILRVEALAQVEGQPAIVMEFVDGLDLQQLIERLARVRRRIPRRSVYRIMADATSAVAAAWEEIPVNGDGPLRVVHRDLKPGNLMVSKQGEVKVLDFGTARFDVGDRLASTGALRFGSLKYMSPERRLGDRGEHESDVYALGIVCLEMLLGEVLPVLPVEQIEHDAYLWELIDRLGDLGLPDSRWDDAARQTLRGMIAAHPGRRLHASQLVPLFRSFSDAATGESLETFASSTVAELCRQVHPPQRGGELAGSRVFVAMTTSADAPLPAPGRGAAPLPGDGPGDATTIDADLHHPDRPTQVTVSITADPILGPGPASPSATAAFAPDDDLPTTISPSTQPPRDRGADHGLPVRAAPRGGTFQEVESVTRPSVSEPPLRARTPPARVAPAAEGGASPFKLALVAGLVVFVLGGLLLTVTAGAAAAWYLHQQRALPTAPADGPGALAPAAGSGLDLLGADAEAPTTPRAAATPARLELRVEDEQIQWMAVEDSAGARAFKGAPGGQAELPTGEYRLLAKVRARGTAAASFRLEGPVRFDCQPAEKGQVRCLADGGGELVLQP